MTLLKYEWRKLAGTPALWAFLALCFLFNCFLLFASLWTCRTFNEGSAIAAQLGQRVDADFVEGLAQLPQTEEHLKLLDFLRKMDNPLEHYDSSTQRQMYGRLLQDAPLAASLMDWKLRQAARRAEHLAETGSALDFFAGPATEEANGILYRLFFKALLTEGILLGVLVMLSLTDHERVHRTTAAVCSSLVCRRLWRIKTLAGVAAALALYLILAAASFAAYFALWDYSGVWGASMASQFNTGIFHESKFSYDTYRPFLPWADFTAGSYLLATTALGAGLVAVFTLLAAACGTLVRNAYASAVGLAVLTAGSWGIWYASYLRGCWAVFVPLSFLPVSLWDQTLGWFTEGGILYFIPWQETVTAVVWLLLGGGGMHLALKRFNRKDVEV